MMSRPLILASRSAARIDMLRKAGIAFEARPAALDEAEIKAALRREGAPARDMADTLAALKAGRVAQKHPDRIVLGADQVLAVEGTVLDKPRDLDEARAQLRFLRGRRHHLFSAAVIHLDAQPIWRHIGKATLVMRDFSDAFLDEYVARHGESLTETVGAYRLEDGGAALFDHVEGDIFTIMGLPLIETLAQLRRLGIART
jgi:septum formation protein